MNTSVTTPPPTPPLLTRWAVYSGTFDPMTFGHQDVIERASRLFDGLIVAVAKAHHKQTRFTLHERIDLVEQFTKTLHASIKVLPFDGLMVDFCKQHQASIIVRGVRNLTDWDYETQMSAMNRKMAPQIETLFLTPAPHLQCISSTLVREIAKLGGSLEEMCNAGVIAKLTTPPPPPPSPPKGSEHGTDDHFRMYQLRCL